jgi:dolichol-phosphate mannosyltransferase
MEQSKRSEGKSREPRTIFVVLPTYNEEHRIGKLLDHIDVAMEEAALRYKAIVIDDGSTDATARLVKERSEDMPIIMRNHERNMGLGATIRDGILVATELARPRDIIVTMDADDTHTPGLILRMVRMIMEGHDVVIASRYQPGARVVGVPFVRVLISCFGSLMFRLLFPIRGVKDFTCGYRAYRAEVIQDAETRYGSRLFNQEGFQCMVDILLKLRKLNLIFGEVPMVLRYDQKEGASKMNVGMTIRRTLGLMARSKFGK